MRDFRSRPSGPGWRHFLTAFAVEPSQPWRARDVHQPSSKREVHMSVVEKGPPRSAGPAPVAETIKVANRLTSTKIAGGMVKEYWDRLFTARERGAPVVWYNGAALNPFFQAAGI